MDASSWRLDCPQCLSFLYKIYTLLRPSPSVSRFKMQFAWEQHPDLHRHLWSPYWSQDSSILNPWHHYLKVTSKIAAANRPCDISFSSVQLLACYIPANGIILHPIAEVKKLTITFDLSFPYTMLVIKPISSTSKITHDNNQFCPSPLLHHSLSPQHLPSFLKPTSWLQFLLVTPHRTFSK